MSEQEIKIYPIDLKNATDHEYTRLNELKNILHSESLPEDPPVPLSERVQQWRNFPDFVKQSSWVVWDASHQQIIAFGEAAFYDTDENEHVAEFNIQVLPEHRRKGLARQFLPRIVEFAEHHQRRLLITGSSEHIPASGAFLERIGAQKVLVNRVNQLKLSELNQDLVNHWLAKAPHLTKVFDLGFWDGVYPDEHLAAIANLQYELSKDVPRDDLEVEAFNFTPEIIRQMENTLFAGGNTRWNIYAIQKTDNQLVGFTEVFMNPSRPGILNQGITGVLPEFRKQGLGSWLKAEMIQRIRQDWPQVEVIRTNNANSNAPMLKINEAMGFKPYLANAVWQVEIEQVKAYLAET